MATYLHYYLELLSHWKTSAIIFCFHNDVWIAVLRLQLIEWHLPDILEKTPCQKDNEELGKDKKIIPKLYHFLG